MRIKYLEKNDQIFHYSILLEFRSGVAMRKTGKQLITNRTFYPPHTQSTPYE